MRISLYILTLFLALSAASCEKRPAGGNYPGGGYPNGGGGSVDAPDDVPDSDVLDISAISSLNKGEETEASHTDALERSSIKLNWRTYKILGEDITGVTKSVYPRMAFTPDGQCQIFYHKEEGTSVAGNRIYRMTSDDLGVWQYKGLFQDIYNITDSHGNNNVQGFADCFPLTLQNGKMISITSTRAVRTVNGFSYRDNKEDAGLVMKTSSDGGKTWSAEAEKIYTGNNWEPFVFQKKNGDIHCYFTDSNQNIYNVWENVYNNSGTALIVSKDNGLTWSEAKRISATLRDQNGSNYLFTNQMPAVIELSTGELVGAFEADKAKGGKSTDYYISFAYSGADGEWDEVSSTASGPADRIDYAFHGCAPYLVHFPSGENVLSYNYNSKFCIRMSEDAGARKWGAETTAFPESGYFWGAMTLSGSHSLFAAIGGSAKGMQTGSFILNHDIKASRHGISIDGSNADWSDTDDALFVGAKSQAQATMRCNSSADEVHFLVEVLDEVISVNDYVTIDTSSPVGTSLSQRSVRITAAVGGLRTVEKWENGVWKSLDNTGVSVATAVDGTTDTVKDKDHGYIIEISVPKSLLAISSDNTMRVNFSHFDTTAGEDSVASSTNLKLWPLINNL